MVSGVKKITVPVMTTTPVYFEDASTSPPCTSRVTDVDEKTRQAEAEEGGRDKESATRGEGHRRKERETRGERRHRHQKRRQMMYFPINANVPLRPPPSGWLRWSTRQAKTSRDLFRELCTVDTRIDARMGMISLGRLEDDAGRNGIGMGASFSREDEDEDEDKDKDKDKDKDENEDEEVFRVLVFFREPFCTPGDRPPQRRLSFSCTS